MEPIYLLGGGFIQDGHWTLPFVGKNLWELWQQVLSRKYHVPFFISFELEKLKKLMTLDPKNRGSIKGHMEPIAKRGPGGSQALQ